MTLYTRTQKRQPVTATGSRRSPTGFPDTTAAPITIFVREALYTLAEAQRKPKPHFMSTMLDGGRISQDQLPPALYSLQPLDLLPFIDIVVP